MTETQVTDTPGHRLPAEWEPQDAVMIAWPHRDTDWAYMLEDIESTYDNLALAILRFAKLVVVTPHSDYVSDRLLRLGCDMKRVAVVDAPTNDTWTRDYGPLTTLDADGNPTLNDFCFNGWGLKFAADRDNLVNRRLVFNGLLPGTYRNCLGFVLEGGSVESDGQGTLLVTRDCLLSPNRNGGMTRREISARLKSVLGAKKVLWLEHGALEGDDTDGHVDTLARLAPNNVVLYVGCQNPADPHYDDLTNMKHDLCALRSAEGRPYSLVELPMAAAAYDEDGNRLPATYANFLIINGGILVPTYNHPKNDHLACQIIQSVFPEHEVVPVDCRALIRQHGSLHCATMQLHSINF